MQPVDKKFNILRPVITANLVRIGRNSDGGYVVDKMILNKSDTLVSFGLGDDWSFEIDFLKNNKDANIYIYDHTVNINPYIKNFLKYLKRFLIFKIKYNDYKVRYEQLKNYIKLKLNKNIKIFSEKITKTKNEKIDTNVIDVFNRLKKNENIILKIDIEESEYDIIDDTLKYCDRVDMLIIEFHFISKNESKFQNLIMKLKKNFFNIHLHGNNHSEKNPSGIPDVLEITFLNKKYLPSSIEFRNNFPIKELDYPNNPNKKDLEFPFIE